MAGNTKFMGFTPDGKVQLERWGGKSTVAVSPESLSALRVACYSELPKGPQQRRRDDLDDFHVGYDEQVGRVRVDMDPATAAYLADRLEFFRDDEVVEKIAPWANDLRVAVQAHHDYHNTDGEPGIE